MYAVLKYDRHGNKSDQKRASEYLIQGGKYRVHRVYVGRSSSEVAIWSSNTEGNHPRFNTVLFDFFVDGQQIDVCQSEHPLITYTYINMLDFDKREEGKINLEFKDSKPRIYNQKFVDEQESLSGGDLEC